MESIWVASLPLFSKSNTRLAAIDIDAAPAEFVGGVKVPVQDMVDPGTNVREPIVPTDLVR